MDQYNLNFHKAIESDEYPQAKRIAEYIKTALKPGYFIDFGCSNGLYVGEVQRQIPEIQAIGYEFSEDALNNAVGANVLKRDLTLPMDDVEKQPNTPGNGGR